MGIINKIFGTVKEVRKPFIEFVSSRFQGYGSLINKQDTLKEYKNWAYACINARSEEVGNIQLVLKNGDEIVESHPLIDLIKRVNPSATKFELFAATQAFKDLDGNAYWYLARDKDGEGDIKEIYLLRPDKVQIIPDEANPLLIKGYIYTQPDGRKVPFSAKEILHHKFFNPLGNHPFPHKGMGVIEAASWAINTDNEVRNWNLNFFKNSARPDGILTVDGEGASSQEEYKRLKESWSQEHQGSDNAHKVGILSGGVKWQELTRTQAEMQFSEQRIFSRDEILALFRTPKSIIGITDDVNRANAEASIYVFALRTVKPLMQQLVDTLNEFLVVEFEDGDLHFEFVSPVPDDRAQVVAEYSAGIDKWLTRNEIRKREGLPATQNGDQFLGQFSLAEIDRVKPEEIKSAKPMKKSSGKQTTGEKLVDDFTAKMPTPKPAVKQLTDLARIKYLDSWKKEIDISAGPLKKELGVYFTKQEREVQKNLREEMKGLQAKEFVLKGLDDVLFDEEDAIGSGISLITPNIREYIKRTGESATLLVGGESFDTGTQAIKRFVEKRAKYFADSITNTTRDSLFKTLKDGTEAGESLESLSERVASVYDIAKGSRSDMIARTEVSAAGNFGAVEAYQQAGIEKHQWAVVEPDDTDCMEADGEIVDLGEEFKNGLTEPPVHPNCLCTTIPIFNE